MSLKKKKKNSDFVPDNSMSEKVLEKSIDNRLPCTSGFILSKELGVSETMIGNYADSLGLKLSKCQIGLFGYAKKGKLIKVLNNPDRQVEAKINELKTGNSLTCENVFRISKELDVSLIDVGSVSQTIGVKITDCRFGAF